MHTLLPGPSRRLAPVIKCNAFLSFQSYIVRDIFGNDTFPNLYDVLVYERKLESEYWERQIYERSLKSEPSIMKFIENQCELLSKLTLYHLKKRATR